SSPTGTQFLHAVGAAEASYRGALSDEIKKHVVGFKGDEVAYVSAGDGTTSEGEFWEALNTASNLKLPVVFLIEDNGYAISVPVEVQTAGGDVSRLVENFPDLLVERFAALLVEEGFVTQDELQKLKDEVDREVNEAADAALASPQPAPDTAEQHIYSPDVDPTSGEFDNEEGAELSGNAGTMVDL